MNDQNHNFFIECLATMLTPIARFCLRRSIKLQDIIECLKQVLIQVAQDEARKQSNTLNSSRLSFMTGVHRKDITRFATEEDSGSGKRNSLIRVMSQWQTDRRYVGKNLKPRVLTIGTNDSEFSTLVWNVSSDLSPGAVFQELERLGLIKLTRGGVKLLSIGFMPKGDFKQGYQLMANDARDLMKAVDENITADPETPNLHVRVEYDNITAEALPDIRRWLLKQGSDFHGKAMKYISQFDKDVNPELVNEPAGGRVVLSGFSFTAAEEGIGTNL